MMEDKSVVIIGGGLGGLFTGCILAREGMEVTVLEKNATPGGGLQSFRRFGESFDTGMHVIGGMYPGGNIRRLCDWLGITGVRLADVDDDVTDSLYFAEDGMRYNIAKGREGFVSSLAEYFPGEKDNLVSYVSAVFSLVGEMDLFHLRPSGEGMRTHSDEFLMPADKFIAKYIKDEKLRAVAAYMNPLYGGRGGRTPAFVHAIITVLYIKGASRFAGGSDRFANLLVNYIESRGGRVMLSDGVTGVEVSDRHVTGVVTGKGKRYEARWYVSAVHPCTLLGLVPEGAFPKSYRTRLESIPNSYSAFSLYIKMKEGAFPYINHSEYYMTRYADIWNFPGRGEGWPLGFLMMTPPEEDQGPRARKVLVTAPMSFDEVRRWENTVTGRRGKEYETWKGEMTGRLLEKAEEMHPGFAGMIENVNSSSPLTIRDFYGSKEGCISGFSKDCDNIVLSQVPVVTKVDNLLLTGQNISLHGFCGVPLTAITTSEAILGKNHVLNSMAACGKS